MRCRLCNSIRLVSVDQTNEKGADQVRCRLCDSIRLVSVLDLGATPPCEKFLTADELDAPEPTYPLHLRLCEDCLLLQIPALITPEETFTEYAYYSSYSDSFVAHAKTFVDEAAISSASETNRSSWRSRATTAICCSMRSPRTSLPRHRAVGECGSGCP